VRELERAELVLHAGDFVAASVLDDLEAYAPVEAVFGNMDERAVIERLPEEHVVEVGETRIGMVHIPGPRLGREERLVRRFPGCAGVVYGHTHIPQVTRHDGIWILNPGSPTERRRAAARSLLVLDVDGGRIEPRLVELR
jgi:putative phosphoesterase